MTVDKVVAILETVSLAYEPWDHLSGKRYFFRQRPGDKWKIWFCIH